MVGPVLVSAPLLVDPSHIAPEKQFSPPNHLRQSTILKNYRYLLLPSKTVTYKITILYSDSEPLGHLDDYAHS